NFSRMLSALITTLLLSDPVADYQQRGTAALKKCQETLAQAQKAQRSDREAAVAQANEAISATAPPRAELAAFMAVDRTQGAPLKGLYPQLRECVRAADFVVVQVAHDSKGPDEEAQLNEYILRYPNEPSTKTVRDWLSKLTAKK